MEWVLTRPAGAASSSIDILGFRISDEPCGNPWGMIPLAGEYYDNAYDIPPVTEDRYRGWERRVVAWLQSLPINGLTTGIATPPISGKCLYIDKNPGYITKTETAPFINISINESAALPAFILVVNNTIRNFISPYSLLLGYSNSALPFETDLPYADIFRTPQIVLPSGTTTITRDNKIRLDLLFSAPLEDVDNSLLSFYDTSQGNTFFRPGFAPYTTPISTFDSIEVRLGGQVLTPKATQYDTDTATFTVNYGWGTEEKHVPVGLFRCELEFEIPEDNPCGALTSQITLKSGYKLPLERHWLAAGCVIDSIGGLGRHGRYFFQPRCFGSAYKVISNKVLLKYDAHVRSFTGGGRATIENKKQVTDSERNSLAAAKLYYETTEVDRVFSITKTQGGTFYNNNVDKHQWNDDIRTDITGLGVSIAPLGDESVRFTNKAPFGATDALVGDIEGELLWFGRGVVPDADNRTSFEQTMSRTCPPAKVLNGQGNFHERIENGKVIVNPDPDVVINGTVIVGCTGYVGTADTRGVNYYLIYRTKMGDIVFNNWALCYHHQNFGELTFVMGEVWDSDYHLATINYLIEGTLATTAWKEKKNSDLFELWFRKSIDGGATWSNPVHVTDAVPVTARVDQIFNTGRYTIIAVNKISTNGGNSWS